MDPITPETPADPVAPVALKSKTLKIHLTPAQDARVKSMAHKHELSKSEFGRLRLLDETDHSLPDASKLEDIARKLAGIANNINQNTAATNAAQKSGTLNSKQFAAMHKVFTDSLEAWAEPLDELRAELQKFKKP